jgi:hypothetical protein
LFKHKQAVSIDPSSTSFSTFKPKIDGVPQGSILGPLLFLVYINDLAHVVSDAGLFMYADDTTLVIKDKNKISAASKLENAIRCIKKWFSINGLTLNSEKTYMVNFHSNYSRNQRADSTYLNQFGTVVDGVRFLGLNVDSRLTWRTHVHLLESKLNKAFYLMLMISQSVDFATLRMIYFAYVYSNINYGVIFWGASNNSLPIFYLQKKIVRLMVRVGRRESCRQIFKDLKLLPLPCIYIFRTILYLHNKIGNHDTVGKLHTYNTRGRDVLSYPLHRTTAFERTPDYMGIRLYNKLHPDIKSSSTLTQFKKSLFDFLVEKSFYSVEEFLQT